ncbi:MAG TPA: uroporphyrinogen-III synthase [Flavisolibacter sp.]
MEKTERYILSTRPLAKGIIESAAEEGIIIEELSFIETHPVQNEELTERIKRLAEVPATIVFTSMNAVDAVADVVSEVKDWKIYCIGHTTRKLVEERLHGALIAGSGENAARLAEQLVDDGVKEAVFFCGNIRRDELPNKIRSEGGRVEELIVYETVELSPALTREYDGILFFSPSAVRAFFRTNKVPRKTELFAIGKTTAETLRPFANKKIIVANATDKVELAQQAIEYFRHSRNDNK